MEVLPLEFYTGDDVVGIARSLLGKILLTNINGVATGGMITETEAYNGAVDRASHAYGNRRTDRTEVMYQRGGISYVYLCYGIHYLLNVVTSAKGTPHAVLIRGIFPTIGQEKILERTGKRKIEYQVTNGPGKLSKALGISLIHNAMDFNGPIIQILDSGFRIQNNDISAGPRIGVDYAGEDAKLPYRFILDYSSYIKKTL